MQIPLTHPPKRMFIQRRLNSRHSPGHLWVNPELFPENQRKMIRKRAGLVSPTFQVTDEPQICGPSASKLSLTILQECFLNPPHTYYLDIIYKLYSNICLNKNLEQSSFSPPSPIPDLWINLPLLAGLRGTIQSVGILLYQEESS